MKGKDPFRTHMQMLKRSRVMADGRRSLGPSLLATWPRSRCHEGEIEEQSRQFIENTSACPESDWVASKAGMSMKIKDMPICDRSIKVWGKGRRRFRVEGSSRNKPKRTNMRCSSQIQGFRPKQTQASYLTCNLWFTAKIGPVFSKFECQLHQGFKLSYLQSISYR